MLFSDTIPSPLTEHPNVSQFMGVLDSLQTHKKECIFKALRAHNPSILMDKKWLLKQLQDYGVTGLPLGIPIQVLQQYLLNVDTICGLRGSRIGLELFCSVLSLGKATIDDEMFFVRPTALILDSPSQGLLTDDNSGNDFFLVDESSDINGMAVIGITIESKFFQDTKSSEYLTIKNYLENAVGDYLGFSPHRRINMAFLPSDKFHFHKLLNPYFI